MKIKFLFFVAAAFYMHIACAQNKTSSTASSFSLGAELSLPVGIFGDVYSFGIGASGQANFHIAANTALTLHAGYINYTLKSTYGSGSQGYVPVLGGVELGFSPTVFGSAQLGLTFFTKGGGSAFTYSPGIGVKITRNFSALLKYVGQTKAGTATSSVGVRVAYTLGK
jgi:hypothetical protein